MTLKEAMGYRGENADTLAEKIGIRAGEVRRWMGENGMLRISGARMQQLAAALDGGVLVTADGAEVELYGQRQDEPQVDQQKDSRKVWRASTGSTRHCTQESGGPAQAAAGKDCDRKAPGREAGGQAV